VRTEDVLNVLAGALAGVGAYAFYNSVLPERPGLLTAGAFVLAAALVATIAEGVM
jgi:hypothetical protein